MKLAASLLAAVACASIAQAQEECASLAEYDALTADLTEMFYDKTYNGLDWPARIAHHRGSVTCESDAQDVARVINALMAELNASHTNIYTAVDQHYWGLNSFFAQNGGDVDSFALPFAGYWAEARDGVWFVKYVFENSPAEHAGLRAGDELIALDGATYAPVTGGEQVTLTISSDGETQRDIALPQPRGSIMRGFIDATADSIQIQTIGDKRVGYVHVWAAYDDILESFNSALASFEDLAVDAVVVDLRGGYGGINPAYLERLQSRDYWKAHPAYFLIDDGARSGKEWVAALVQRDRLGVLVGSNTAGTFLGGAPLRRFDDKYFMFVAVAPGDIPGIPRLEGVGVAPDVAVDPCRTYCQGVDPQLDRALELIRNG